MSTSSIKLYNHAFRKKVRRTTKWTFKHGISSDKGWQADRKIIKVDYEKTKIYFRPTVRQIIHVNYNRTD